MKTQVLNRDISHHPQILSVVVIFAQETPGAVRVTVCNNMATASGNSTKKFYRHKMMQSGPPLGLLICTPHRSVRVSILKAGEVFLYLPAICLRS
jgi:hypothetical protein